MIHLPAAGTAHRVPFGRPGIASYGAREHGRAAAESCTTVETASVAAGEPA